MALIYIYIHSNDMHTHSRVYGTTETYAQTTTVVNFIQVFWLDT